MMTIAEFMHEVHENTKAHGWWDKPRSERGVRALIVSEWIEALEEARGKGRMAYEGEDGKPEGIAVELMDGCIRILDWLGHIGYNDSCMPEKITDMIWNGRGNIKIQCVGKEDELGVFYTAEDMPVDVLVDVLDEMTMKSTGGYRAYAYIQAMSIACAWVDAHGLDPEKLMLDKHEYNKTRPYKHGKQF